MKNIYAAFVRAQTGFAPALKTSSNPHFKSRYADLAAVVEAVIDSLNAHDIGLIQKTHPDETGVTVETVLVHGASGEAMECGKLHVPAAKQDPQGYGSALTYARRYSLMAACGIAPEDDDGNAASKPRVQVGQTGAPRGVAGAVLATSPAIEPKRAAYIKGLGEDLIREYEEGRTAGSILDAIKAEKPPLDDVESIYLSTLMPSNMKRALQEESRARHNPKKETA